MVDWPLSRSSRSRLARAHQAVGVDHQRAAVVAHEVERARLGEVFEGAAVRRGKVGAFAEVLDVAVGAVFFAHGDDAFDGRRADVLDDADAEADGERAIGAAFDARSSPGWR